MEESQRGISEYPFSQHDMPSSKRQRRGSKKQYGKRGGKTSLPVAIRTRGTPAGYYEIPVRQLIKLYCNTSTGFWDTNQTTGAPLGTTGYRGIGLAFALDGTYYQLGEGATSISTFNAVPGFTDMQTVFDMCKIVDVDIQTWWTNQQDTNSTAASYGAWDLYIAEDPNNADPPLNIGAVMQYQKVKRHNSQSAYTVDYKIKPHMRMSVGTSADEVGTTTTLGDVVPSSYIQCSKSGALHFGFRGWVDCPTSATARVTTLNILVTQTRRYKLSK